MRNEIKGKAFLYLASLGAYAIFISLWKILEIFHYGGIQSNLIDSIIGIFIYWSIYYNLKYWLLNERWDEE